MTQINSISYAEYLLKNLMGVSSVNLNGIKDKQVLTEIVDAFSECVGLYPEIINSICHIGNSVDEDYYLNLLDNSFDRRDLNWEVHDWQEPFCVYAYAFDESRKPLDFLGISIGPDIMKHNLEDINYCYSDAADRGYFVEHGGTLRGTIIHEVAHILDFILGISNDPEFLALIKDIDISQEISEYAAKDNLETFAEAMTEYHLSPNPSPLIQAIGDLTNRRYEAVINNKPKYFELVRRYKC